MAKNRRNKDQSHNSKDASNEEKEDEEKEEKAEADVGARDATNEDEPTAQEPTDEQGKKRRQRKRKRKKKSDQEQDDDNNNDENEGENNNKKRIIDNKDVPCSETERAAQVERTVFVEGIPFTATPANVQDFFRQHGLNDIVECRLPVWQDSGRLRGYGHVVFETTASAVKAVQELNGKYLNQRYLTITQARKPKDVDEKYNTNNSSSSSEPSTTILLQNLSYDATEKDIEAVLAPFGTIVPGGVRVVRHSAGERRSKGFAYVQFDNVETAQTVMNTRILILNRPCRTDYDHGRIKGSFRAADGRFWKSEYGKSQPANNNNNNDEKRR